MDVSTPIGDILVSIDHEREESTHALGSRSNEVFRVVNRKKSKSVTEKLAESSMSKIVGLDAPSLPNILKRKPQVDMSKFLPTPNDSTDPSYTKLTQPYSVICRQRYRNAGAQQRAQFINEIRNHELFQSKALDGVRIHREFCEDLIHNIQPQERVTLTDIQKAKIEKILARKIEF